MKSGIVRLRGVVTRVRATRPDSPWMAGSLKTEDGQTVSFSGKCFAEQGDTLEIVGEWKENPRWGWQVEATSGVVKVDESPAALIHLLSAHKEFKGIGPVRAQAIVDAALNLSDDGEVSSALLNYPEEIAERSGVQVKVIRNAAKVWNGRRQYFEALAQLGEQGWSANQSMRIVTVMGENAPTMVRADPYGLIGKIDRFGFRTVDIVARRMGVKTTDPLRMHAGVAFCLDKIAFDGHTWTTREALLYRTSAELRPDTLDGEDKIRDTIQSMIDEGFIHLDTTPEGEELVSDARLAKCELAVFDRLVSMLEDGQVDRFSVYGPRAREVVPSLTAGQLQAFNGFSSHRCSVISGGAGVGKTYMVRAICEVAEENQQRLALCAPTGKAARKLSHSTTRGATTIHRLLEPLFDETTGSFGFTRNAGNPLNLDLVIVDEVSMVDVRLMHSLLSALRDSCRLVLVGDHHQIPSVGPGAILRDLIAAQARYPDSVHKLTEIVRQAGTLARNTTAILDGVVAPNSSEVWGIEKCEKGHVKDAANKARLLVEALVTAPEPLQPFGRLIDMQWDVQVLSPQKKGELGVHALNTELQALRQRMLGNLPPKRPEADKPPRPLPGDRVIWTRNDSVLDLSNGTQARVDSIEKDGSMKITVEDGREVVVPASKRDRVEVAYALTIHKAQGSEWPFVLLIVSSAHWKMHDRNLFYTGASRASESLTILGDMAGIRHFASERKSDARQTFGRFLLNGWRPKQHPLSVVG